MASVHYLIYKITNNLNGKIYIGKHITEDLDDGYMGSGIVIQKAIKKYGVENFTKEILFDVYGEDLMNFLEEAIVDEAFVARNDTYNLRTGGAGGHILEVSEETREKISKGNKGKIVSDETRRKLSEAHKGRVFTEEWKIKIGNGRRGKYHTEETKKKISEATKRGMDDDVRKHLSQVMKEKNPWVGKHLPEEIRKKMSESMKGHSVSEETRQKLSEAQMGKHWFTNGVTNKLSLECPEGFWPGRIIKAS